MIPVITNKDDVVSFLKSQHQQIKMLFGEVGTTHGPDREQAFYDLRRLLAVHETAEEEIVHPKAKNQIPDGEHIVDERLKEENTAKKALAELESMDIESAEFNAALTTLLDAVVAHAEAEEHDEFGPLKTKLDDDQLAKMQRAAEIAEEWAPTRPHPGVESSAANLIVGPFAAMIDRARDTMSRPR